jgi:regulator of protease activity HflC (stomatin/prohibitin superfamily)
MYLLTVSLHFDLVPDDVLVVRTVERAMRAEQAERAVANQRRSLEAFLAAKAEFDALVAELQAMSADHFGADPKAVLWGTRPASPTGPDGCAR